MSLDEDLGDFDDTIGDGAYKSFGWKDVGKFALVNLGYASLLGFGSYLSILIYQSFSTLEINGFALAASMTVFSDVIETAKKNGNLEKALYNDIGTFSGVYLACYLA